MKQMHIVIGLLLLSSCINLRDDAKTKSTSQDSTVNDNVPVSIPSTASADTTTRLPTSLRTWIEEKLGDEELDTASYFAINIRTQRVCCESFKSWYFDEDFYLKYYCVISSIDGTDYLNRYCFSANKIIGGIESVSAADYRSDTFFTIDKSVDGFILEEDLFSDTIVAVSTENISKKVTRIDYEKKAMIEVLSQMASATWVDEGEELSTEILNAISDHENEKSTYTVDKPLFNQIVKVNN